MALPGQKKTYQSEFGGGVNNGIVAAHKIADNEARSMQNLASYDQPILETIYASEMLGSSFAASVDLLAVFGIGTLCAISAGGFYTWTGAAWSTVLSTNVTGTEYSACNFNGELVIGMNSTNGLQAFTGAVVFSPSTNSPHAPYVTQNDNRVYACGHNANDVRFCALNDVTDWVTAGDAGAGTITIQSPSGESNTGIGALGPGRVIVFKPTSYHEIFGTGPINYTVANRYYGVGCMANKTIVNINNWIYWLGIDGVYRTNGGLPERISDKVKNLLPDQTVGSLLSLICAGSDRRFYYLSIDVNKILAYDTFTDTWWGPWNYSQEARSMVKFNGTASKGFYVGNKSGDVIRIDDSSSTGTVTWNWISKSDFGKSLSDLESVSNLRVTAEIFSGASMNVSFSNRFKDSGLPSDWTVVSTITSTGLQAYNIPLPLIPDHEFHRIKFDGTGKVNIYGIDKEVREGV